jgi:hypothetical protein
MMGYGSFRVGSCCDGVKEEGNTKLPALAFLLVLAATTGFEIEVHLVLLPREPGL